MSDRIDRDVNRFRHIVRGKIRENLRKYITHGEMLGRKGRDLVSIPVPQLDVPHFRYGKNGSRGVGQGDGQPGQPIGRGDDEGGSGSAGSDPGPAIHSTPAPRVATCRLRLSACSLLRRSALKSPRITTSNGAQSSSVRGSDVSGSSPSCA